MVKQYDLGTGVNPTKRREGIKAQTVAKYKLYDAIAMLNSITVYIKHGPRGWCESRFCVLDLPTQVQATFPVKIWAEKGQ